MEDYLSGYGVEDTRRSRIIKRVVLATVATLIVAVAAYLFLKNYKEKRTVKNFLSEVNSGQLPAAYTTWGCTATHPCRDYSYQKFLDDWGHKKNWKISDVDGCPAGVVVTVKADGTEPAPLWVTRADDALSFSPWPECQGKQWRWKQFFKKITGH
jgi:hypothetical protein